MAGTKKPAEAVRFLYKNR